MVRQCLIAGAMALSALCGHPYSFDPGWPIAWCKRAGVDECCVFTPLDPIQLTSRIIGTEDASDYTHMGRQQGIRLLAARTVRCGGRGLGPLRS